MMDPENPRVEKGGFFLGRRGIGGIGDLVETPISYYKMTPISYKWSYFTPINSKTNG